MGGFDGWGLTSSSSIPGYLQHVSFSFDMFRQAPTGEVVNLDPICRPDGMASMSPLGCCDQSRHFIRKFHATVKLTFLLGSVRMMSRTISVHQ